MRRILVLVVVAMVMALPGPAGAQAQEEPSTTCRIDAAAVQAVLDAQISCLSLDTEIYGEFDAAAVVTLQRRAGDIWVDLASETCTSTSTEGVMELNCSVTSQDAIGEDVRGLVDLDAPQEWPAAVAAPTYTGAYPVTEPLAEDACDLNETAEPSDLTPPDAPWADLCAVTMTSELDDEGEVAAVSVVTHVAGWLQERTPTTAWTTRFRVADGCTHELVIADDGVTGEASARVDTGCDYVPGECTGLSKVLTDLLGGVCASSGTYGYHESTPLPADAVTFTGAEVIVTLRPDELDGVLAQDLTVGSVIGSASASTTSGLGSDDSRVIFDSDTAWSTGRTYTLGD